MCDDSWAAKWTAQLVPFYGRVTKDFPVNGQLSSLSKGLYFSITNTIQKSENLNKTCTKTQDIEKNVIFAFLPF